MPSGRIATPAVLHLNKKQAAKMMDVSAPTFGRILQSGDPPPVDHDGTIPSDKFGQWLINYGRKKTVGGDGDDRDAIDPAYERARKDKVQADKAEFELEVKRGIYLDRNVVEQAGIDMAMRIRARMMRLGAATAPLVVGETTLSAVQSVIDEQIRDAMSELSELWMGESDGNGD